MINPILLMRTEMVCLIILLYIRFSSKIYQLQKDEKTFSRLFYMALGHVFFDLITIYTVNHTHIIPAWLNWGCQVIFYLFAIVFSYYLLVYVLQVSKIRKSVEVIKRINRVLVAIYVVCLPFLTIEYLQGIGTKYSMGTAAYAGYVLALLMFLESLLIIVLNKKNMDRHVVRSLLPALGILVILELAQVIIPELLFTGAGLTIVTIGLFFSLENPIYIFQKKVFRTWRLAF